MSIVKVDYGTVSGGGNSYNETLTNVSQTTANDIVVDIGFSNPSAIIIIGDGTIDVNIVKDEENSTYLVDEYYYGGTKYDGTPYLTITMTGNSLSFHNATGNCTFTTLRIMAIG